MSKFDRIVLDIVYCIATGCALALLFGWPILMETIQPVDLLVQVEDNNPIIEKEEKIMTYNEQCDANERLIEAMLRGRGHLLCSRANVSKAVTQDDKDFDARYCLGYLTSFLAGSMVEYPELREKVKNRVLWQIENSERAA